jgi:hypothetical protein
VSRSRKREINYSPVASILDERSAPREEIVTEARAVEQTNERTKRQSFDLREDQIRGLTRLQATLFDQTGRKPKMGELAQEAFDLLLRKYGVGL